MRVCVYPWEIYVYPSSSGRACRGQRTSDPPELELQACEMPDMGVCVCGNCLSQEQYALYTAEPLLQFIFFKLKNTCISISCICAH